MIFYCKHKTAIGPIYCVADETAVLAVAFEGNWKSVRDRVEAFEGMRAIEKSSRLLKQVTREVDEYLAGTRKKFEVPFRLSVGTKFQRQVWLALREIPYASTITYSGQASRVGSASAVRAVGRTNGLNPLSLLLPCHRVIAKSGALTGYAGGIKIKEHLLDLETRVETGAR